MNFPVFAGDTETTWYEDYLIDGVVRVYLWHIRRLPLTKPLPRSFPLDTEDTEEYIGYDVGSLVEWMETRKVTTTLWFHNLRFDGSFIVDWLLKHGYTSETYDEVRIRKEGKKFAKKAWLDDNDLPAFITSDDGKRKQTYIPRKVTKPYDTPRKSVSIIKSGSSWINLTIVNARGTVIKLYDSGNKYTTCGSLEDIANAIGEEGKSVLPKVRRDLSYTATPEDIARVKGDTRILAKAMAIMYDNGYYASTLAGDAWKTWTSMYEQTHEEGDFEKCYPKIEDEYKFPDGTVVDIRDAYKGGVTYCNPDYANKDVKDIMGLDCNSEHPTSMYYYETPVGKPILSVNKPLSSVAIVHFHASAKLKPGMEPCQQKSNSFRSGEVEWLIETDPTGEDFTMTCDDFERFAQRYDIFPNVESITKYYVNFYHRLGKCQFGVYIDHFMAEKKAQKKIMNELKSKGLDTPEALLSYKEANIKYYLAKIMLNALYGKFGQISEKPYQWGTLDGDRIRVEESNVDNGEFFEPFSHKYLPTAIFTTSWSRCQIYNEDSILDAYNVTRYYKDTDSEYFDGSIFKDGDELVKQLESMGIEIHPSRLGAWDIEHSHEPEARFIRAKAYIMKEKKGRLTVKCGGMPESVKKHVTWENFHPGAEFGEECGKLMPVMVNGGTVLKPVTYKLRE